MPNAENWVSINSILNNLPLNFWCEEGKEKKCSITHVGKKQLNKLKS